MCSARAPSGAAHHIDMTTNARSSLLSRRRDDRLIGSPFEAPNLSRSLNRLTSARLLAVDASTRRPQQLHLTAFESRGPQSARIVVEAAFLSICNVLQCCPYWA